MCWTSRTEVICSMYSIDVPFHFWYISKLHIVRWSVFCFSEAPKRHSSNLVKKHRNFICLSPDRCWDGLKPHARHWMIDFSMNNEPTEIVTAIIACRLRIVVETLSYIAMQWQTHLRTFQFWQPIYGNCLLLHIVGIGTATVVAIGRFVCFIVANASCNPRTLHEQHKCWQRIDGLTLTLKLPSLLLSIFNEHFLNT